MMEKKRSVGVTIFGIIFLILAICPMPAIIRLVLTVLLANVSKTPNLTIIQFVSALSEFIIYSSCVFVYLALGFGILRLKEWARRQTLYIGWLPILLYILSGVMSGYEGKLYIFAIPLLCFVGMISYFFTRPKVKEQFK